MRRKVLKKKKEICEKYPDRYNMDMCLAKLKNPTGEKRRCTKAPIRGKLRCKLHGGKSPGAPIKHGRYSMKGKGKFIKVYEKFLLDPNIMNLADEIALLRSLLHDLVSIKVKKGDILSRNDKIELSEKMAGLVDAVGKMADRLRKIHVSYFSMESLAIVIQQLVSIIEQQINECPHCGKPIYDVRNKLCKAILDLNIPGTEPIEIDYETEEM